MNTPVKSSARRSNLTKAELEAMVNQLKAALEEAKNEGNLAELREALHESHTKEGYLQQQIIDLKSDLELEKKLVHKLQKELEKIDEIKAELEQAKKAASRLATANEKLTEEIQTLKAESKNIKVQEMSIVGYTNPGRPIQKESDQPDDFAKKSWLL